MLKSVSFRAKLLLVLFVPFLALVVVGAAGLHDRFSALRAQEQYGDLSAPLQSLDQASRALENESVVSSWYVAGKGGPPEVLTAARNHTDAAVREFRIREEAFAVAGLSEAAAGVLDAANKSLDAIKEERGRVDTLTSDAAATRAFFLGADANVLGFGERVARDLADPEVSASLTRAFSLERARHELAREASVYIAVLAGQQQDFGEWISATAARAKYQADFTNGATPAELQAYRNALGPDPVATTLPSAFPAISQAPAAYAEQYEQQAAALDRTINSVDGLIRDASSANAADALRDTRLYGGAAVFAMLLTLLLIWFVSRAVVGPVRHLTAAAREMSQRQLPALVESLRTGGDVSAVQSTRIDVTSEDEIGELAQAFNDIEAVTMEVAQEQSRLLRKGMGDLFVNLARRNQSLLERQLELLDELERNEHDPSALDALFKLDHMATRMRRNAESLLVLSGAEQPRQWQEPIALLDVVRAAAAEIADFPRVELIGIDDDLALAGRAVADVAHLVAELLENATSFSPPDSAVVVSGAATSTGFVLAVSDQGIGMSRERIAEANRLLARPPLVGLALSRALGLHVVGSLAARHGITVELRSGAPLGLVALVTLPQAVLEPRPAPAPQLPVYEPEIDTDGTPAPLGARRVAWRPPDEPPVEEWRQAGLGDRTMSPGNPEPVAPASRTMSEPETPPAFTPPPFTPPEEPAAFEPPPAFTPPPEEPPVEPPPADQFPLPTRVPGQHLSHQPNAWADHAGEEPDPLRPYRVHELLTRHAQGKREGRAEYEAGQHKGSDGNGSHRNGSDRTSSDAHRREDAR